MHHHFCENCGVATMMKSCAESDPLDETSTIAINGVTLDQEQELDLRALKIEYWNGKDWSSSEPSDKPFKGGCW